MVAAEAGDYLMHLSEFVQKLSKIDNVDLRLYIEKPLSDDLVQAIENGLTKSGANLCSPLRQEAGIVRIIFNYTEALPAAIANIKLPTIIGWQVFDAAGNCLRGMRKFDNNVAVVEEKP